MTESLSNMDSVITAISAAHFYENDKGVNSRKPLVPDNNYYVVPLVFCMRQQFKFKGDIIKLLSNYNIDYNHLLF